MMKKCFSWSFAIMMISPLAGCVVDTSGEERADEERTDEERTDEAIEALIEQSEDPGGGGGTTSSVLACSGNGLIHTISDGCMDDWGQSSVGDKLEVYCVSGISRFCLSGESCPWRPQPSSAQTCSMSGLGSAFMATASCNQYFGYSQYNCNNGVIDIPASNLTCSGAGLIHTINDACMDDGGQSSAGDNLEVYCANGIPRFCLSGEYCPWRSVASANPAQTCSTDGLGSTNHLAHATCSQWRGYNDYYCDSGNIRLE